MIDGFNTEIVRVIEGGDMDLKDVQNHLAEVAMELGAVAAAFGRVSLLIDATNKYFSDLKAQAYWSKNIRMLPQDLPYYRMAFVVLEEDSAYANAYTSDKPWFGAFSSIAAARRWLTQ